LLRDIGRIKENVGAAKTIDWAQYKGILTRFSDAGSVAGASGNDTALWCYARVLELILDDRRWEKLRTESEALVFWLLKIGYPGVSERDGLEQFNQSASFMWAVEESRKIQQKRAATLAKFQQSGRVIKKDKEDIEDDRLMALVSRNKGDALEKLRKRHEGLVRATVREVLKGNSDVDDIVADVFIQVWKAAPEYVPTGKFTAWLTTIAKNRAINKWKRAKSERERVEFAHIGEDDSAEANDGGYSEGGDGEKSDALGALSQLPLLEQRIMEARFLCKRSERKDRQELADELGITAGDVEALEKEALTKLRQSLGSLKGY
jgi:RNA polymerase sigma-70 factor (ECF subfamily)